MAKEPDKTDREVKTRKAEAKVKGLVSKEGALVKSDNALKADRANKVSTAASKVKDLVTKEGALVKSDNALKASKVAKAVEGESFLSKASRIAGKAGEVVRGGLRTARGKAGPLSALALGASVAMEAGHAVDQAIAKGRSDKPGPADKPSLGPRRNAASTAKAESAAPAKTPEKSPAKTESAKPSPKSDAPAKKGAYPTYSKGSSNAASFRTAFAAAKKAGKEGFTWEGRKYNTKLKGK
jgi:hypothetical protein